MSHPAPLVGTLLLPLATVEKTGNLFPLMALTLRAAGMQVLVVAQGTGNVEKRAAELSIPFTEAKDTNLTGKLFQDWKFGVAMRQLAHGAVIWPDLEFAQWAGPACNGITGLTVVNIGALLAQGMAPKAGYAG